MRMVLAGLIFLGLALPAAADEITALSTFRDCEHCPEMVVLPQGAFEMGAATAKEKALARLGLQIDRSVTVDIAYTFAIGKYEVTVAEFGAFVDATGYDASGPCALRLADEGPNRHQFIGEVLDSPDNMLDVGFVWVKQATFRVPGREVTDRHPATCISRDDMDAYLAWLSHVTGRHYRFATSAEWEYAARAGTTTLWFWGDSPKKACDYANFADRKSVTSANMAAPCADKVASDGTTPVGSYKPNAWGLYDMVGNVGDVVADCLPESYDEAPVDGSPFMIPSNTSPARDGGTECGLSGGNFVARGSDFTMVVDGLASAMLLPADRKIRANLLGFRAAVSLSGSAWNLPR